MERLHWLDGLRGIAAAIVSFDHAFDLEPQFAAVFRSFWADPPEENRHFFQLPPIKLLFAAPSMVTIFFVISGFSISMSLVRVRKTSLIAIDQAAFLRRLASAATRRTFRLFIPVFTLLIISHVLFFLNLYHLETPDNVSPLKEPWVHIKQLFSDMASLLDWVAANRPTRIYLIHLWTMSIEYRGSLIVYLTILATSFRNPRYRCLELVMMAAFWLYLGYWDLFAFLVGLLLAERRIMSEMAEGDGELCLPAESTKPPRTIIRAWKNITKSTIFDLIRTSAFLLLGLYFICIDAYSVLPPGYQFLQSIQSPYWHDTLTANECWETIGAVLVIFAISQSNYLQYPLNSRPIQYLGKISFSLYLVHPSVYFMLLQPIRDLVWFLISQKPYPGTVEAIYYTLPFWSAWTASFLITAGVIIVIAHFFTRFIDEKSVIIARSIEKKISVL